MWSLLIPTFFLAVFGLFNLVGIKSYLLMNQLVFILIGVIAFIIIRKIGIHFFRVNALMIYFVFLFLLFITFFIGVNVNGSIRWINLYFFNFQPSELFKIFYIVMLADFLARNQRNLNKFSVFALLTLSYVIPGILIFRQPDLEVAMFIGVLFLGICVFSEIPKRYIVTLLIIVTLIAPFSWTFLKQYQRARILTFMNPNLDTQGTAYNMAQSIITIGSGEVFGRGLGLGKQSTLFFLPENHTDFAFASLVEQFGFVGGLSVIILFIVMTLILIRNVLHNAYKKGEHNRFQYFYTLGFLLYFIYQVFVNIGMNVGLLPISGTALPLISYGGSSVITLMIGLAFLSNEA